jgi:diaminopimelate epimerase
MNAPSTILFRKMNGLGNDFIVLDARQRDIPLDRATIRALTDRESGIGCDQLIRMEADGKADLFMRIWNASGEEVAACGNATRCVAGLVMAETGRDTATIRTAAGLLKARDGGDGRISVDMGMPKFGWREIPLAEEFADTRRIELQVGPIDNPVLHSPSAVNVGNPHCIFWVDDVDAHDLARVGPFLENHIMFPERANISLARITGEDEITIRVWERGAGLTRACGTAACAVAVAAARLKKTGRHVTVHLPGGPLGIHWREADDHIIMSGPWQLDYESTLDVSVPGT